MNSTLRASRAAYDAYNRPAYYPVAQPVVTPVNPYYGY
jgi:hypothetical protein